MLTLVIGSALTMPISNQHVLNELSSSRVLSCYIKGCAPPTIDEWCTGNPYPGGEYCQQSMANCVGSCNGEWLDPPLEYANGPETTMMNGLVWNPHWECFAANNATCAAPAMSTANAMLAGNSVDFAGFIMLEEMTYQPPPPYQKVGGNVCTEGYTDWSTLVYDAGVWSPVGKSVSGCLPRPPHSNDVRAYVLQSFDHLESNFSLVVASVHMPHPSYSSGDAEDPDNLVYENALKFLKTELRGMASHERLLFLSDTNLNAPRSQPGGIASATNTMLFNRLGYTGMPAVSSELFNSCCAHDRFPQAGKAPVDQTWAADRAFASFGSNARTAFPLKAGPYPHRAPSFLRDTMAANSSAHLPVLLSFQYAPQGERAGQVRLAVRSSLS